MNKPLTLDTVESVEHEFIRVINNDVIAHASYNEAVRMGLDEVSCPKHVVSQMSNANRRLVSLLSDRVVEENNSRQRELAWRFFYK